MRQKRAAVLQAQPYERTDVRLGRANGFKPKTVATRMAPITFSIPQVRDGIAFYPSALDKGVRNEQALKLALAEMYVQGVSNRKVTAVLEKLCGLEISSTQVSHCAAQLDAVRADWRSRPLGLLLTRSFIGSFRRPVVASASRPPSPLAGAAQRRDSRRPARRRRAAPGSRPGGRPAGWRR